MEPKAKRPRKGGYQGCIINPGDYIYADEITLPSDNKCPSDAVLEIINNINETLAEFIFTLMYPYFRALGVYSIKPEFYVWANNTIKGNINKPQQFVTFDKFKEEFEKFHGPITTDDIDEEIVRAEPPNNNNEGYYANNENGFVGELPAEVAVASAQGAIVGKLVKPNESSSFSGATFGQAGPLPPPPPINTGAHSPNRAAYLRQQYESPLAVPLGTGPLGPGSGKTPGTVTAKEGVLVKGTPTGSAAPLSTYKGPNSSSSPPHGPVKKLNLGSPPPRKGGGNRPRHKTRLRRKSKKLRKYRKTRKVRRNKSTK